MTLQEAIIECKRWHSYLDGQREKTKLLQEAARCAKRGDIAETNKLKNIADEFAPTVYDCADLENATKVLVKRLECNQND